MQTATQLAKKPKKAANKVAHNHKPPKRFKGAEPIEVPINVVKDPSGNVVISVPPFTDCTKNDVVAYSLVQPCDAIDFSVTFKSENPFEGTPPFKKGNPHTGKCKGIKGKYAYNLTLTMQDCTTITLDPVIIVDGN